MSEIERTYLIYAGYNFEWLILVNKNHFYIQFMSVLVGILDIIYNHFGLFLMKIANNALLNTFVHKYAQ